MGKTKNKRKEDTRNKQVQLLINSRTHYLGLTKSSCTAIGSFLDQLTLDLFFS